MSTKKQVVETALCPQTLAVMPYAAAVKHNGMVYLSGNIGMDPNTRKLVEGDIKARTRMIMSIITNVLADSGTDIKNIIKCSEFLTDMADLADMNEAYLGFFPDAKDIPARTCVQVAGLPLGMDIEIECFAHL
ncbi:endoribonuclease L-PSP [Paraphoma chrysanthemicola]|uniref:Endoribonuclease L-PSP n=1 Tax=Paraphoma chrysanthemicola TaxID=798071 RepID=A0A8K0R6C8_9PLEO|nr:endoribonuclease L-PSP [Paraphoma chrysanthemicola]